MFSPNHDQISGIIWFIVGTIIAIVSIRHGLGSLQSPEVGFMPFLASFAICVFSFITLVHGSLQQKQGVRWKPMMSSLKWNKSLMVFVSLLAYALLQERLGFFLCTGIFVAVLFRVVKPLKWSIVITGSILTVLLTYGIFGLWLKAQLPKGPWGF